MTVNINQQAGAPTMSAAARPSIEVDPQMLASAGQRLGAGVIDAAIVSGGLLGASMIHGLFDAGAIAAALPPAALAAAALYSLLYPARCGQTLGKHLLGIQLVRADDGATAIGGGAAFGREIIKGLGASALGLGLMWILFDRHRQGWHDHAGGTVVVRTDQPKLSARDFLAAPFRN